MRRICQLLIMIVCLSVVLGATSLACDAGEEPSLAPTQTVGPGIAAPVPQPATLTPTSAPKPSSHGNTYTKSYGYSETVSHSNAYSSAHVHARATSHRNRNAAAHIHPKTASNGHARTESHSRPACRQQGRQYGYDPSGNGDVRPSNPRVDAKVGSSRRRDSDGKGWAVGAG